MPAGHSLAALLPGSRSGGLLPHQCPASAMVHAFSTLLRTPACAHRNAPAPGPQVFLTSTHLVLAMEYAAGGDLFRYVAVRRGLPEDEARWFFQQLMIAVDYCHRMVRWQGWMAGGRCLFHGGAECLRRRTARARSLVRRAAGLAHARRSCRTPPLPQGVSSRDIKLENTLVDGSPRPLIKLADFGFSKVGRGGELQLAMGPGWPRKCAAGGRAAPAHAVAPPTQPARPSWHADSGCMAAPLPLVGLLQDANQHSAPTSRVGTPAYLAPEVITNQPGQVYDGQVQGLGKSSAAGFARQDLIHLLGYK